MLQSYRIFNLRTGLFALLAILIFILIILSLVPPVSKDALVHHLSVPKLYLKHGGIYEIPYMDFSYYPMNFELLYMIPLHFGNDIVPKLIHFTFALMTALLIFRYLEKKAGSLYGLFGVLFFLSIPVIVKLSVTAYVDLGEIFFSLAALIFIFRWIENSFQLKYLILSGIFCGLALGTKYNGLVTLVILTLFIPFVYSRYNKRPAFFRSSAYGVIFLAISLLIFSPWMIRDYHWKGNPIYPLHNKIFHSPNGIVKDRPSKGGSIPMNRGFFTYRSMIYNESGLQIALLPIRIFFEGKDGDPQHFDGKLNPFLLLLPFIAFYGIKNDPVNMRGEKKILLLFSVLFFFFAFFTSVLRIRYISPIIPPLIILSMFGVKNMFGIASEFRTNLQRQLGRAIILLILAFSLSLNAFYIIGQFIYVKPFSFITGMIGRDEYITQYRPEYPAMKYINKNLAFDSRILFIFLGRRGYYCDREYIYGTGMVRNLIKRSERPEEILSGFSERGITHLFVLFPLMNTWINDNFKDGKKALIQEFFRKHTKLLFEKNGFGVLGLE